MSDTSIVGYLFATDTLWFCNIQPSSLGECVLVSGASFIRNVWGTSLSNGNVEDKVRNMFSTIVWNRRKEDVVIPSNYMTDKLRSGTCHEPGTNICKWLTYLDIVYLKGCQSLFVFHSVIEWMSEWVSEWVSRWVSQCFVWTRAWQHLEHMTERQLP